MKTCWLHIGMHKTGSTSIQANLAQIQDPKGWRYISVARGPNMGKALYAMFATNPHRFHWFVKQDKPPKDIDRWGADLRKRFTNAIDAVTEDIVIVSAEALPLIDKKGLAALRDLLKSRFDVIKVIGYVRPPLGYINSMFQQQVKHGRGEFGFKGAQPKYRHRFQKFDALFGRENVLLRKFDPSSFPNGCIVEDFCAQVGIQGPPPGGARRVNESLCREACGLLYAYRKFGPGYGSGPNVLRENSAIIRPMFAMCGAKFNLDESLLAKQVRRADLEYMENRLGMDLRETVAPGGIRDEKALLLIRRDSCLDYAERFQELYGVRIPAANIPASDPVDPREAAQMIQCGRGITKKLIPEGNRASKIESLVPIAGLKDLMDWGRRRLGLKFHAPVVKKRVRRNSGSSKRGGASPN